MGSNINDTCLGLHAALDEMFHAILHDIVLGCIASGMRSGRRVGFVQVEAGSFAGDMLVPRL
jgi:hypothetical protein